MPRGGSRYNWVSPGAAAVEAFSGSLDRAVKEREAKSRQDRLDRIEDARIQRETTESAARMKIMLEDQDFQRDQIKDQQTRQKVADLGLMRGDEVPEWARPYVPHDLEQTVGGRSLGSISTAIPTATERGPTSLLGPEAAPPPDEPVQRPMRPDAPGVMVPPTPAMIAQSATGKATAKGTVAERQLDQKKQALGEVLKANPTFMQNPAVKTAMEIMAKTGDMSTLDNVVTQLLKPKDTPTIGSFEDFVVQKYGPRPNAQQIEKAREEYRLEQRFTPIVLQNYAGAGGGPAQWTPGSDRVTPIGSAGGADGFLPPDMDPRWKTVAINVTDELDPAKRSQVLASIGRMAKDGNTAGVGQRLYNLVKSNEDVSTTRQIDGREALLAATSDVRSMLGEMQKNGLDTGILGGSLEKALEFVGKTRDPRYAAFKVRLDAALQSYRQAKSGLAFSQKEGEEYVRMNPEITNDMPLNFAKLDGLERAIRVEDQSYWRSRLGDEADLVLSARSGRPSVPIRPQSPGQPGQTPPGTDISRGFNTAQPATGAPGGTTPSDPGGIRRPR